METKLRGNNSFLLKCFEILRCCMHPHYRNNLNFVYIIINLNRSRESRFTIVPVRRRKGFSWDLFCQHIYKVR